MYLYRLSSNKLTEDLWKVFLVLLHDWHTCTCLWIMIELSFHHDWHTCIRLMIDWLVLHHDWHTCIRLMIESLGVCFLTNNHACDIAHETLKLPDLCHQWYHTFMVPMLPWCQPKGLWECERARMWNLNWKTMRWFAP